MLAVCMSVLSVMLVCCLLLLFCFFELYGDHRELHVLTHSFPTRRSSYLVAAAGFDPLRDSDRAYADALKKAGVHTVYLEYSSLPHGFLQQTAVTREADRAAGETARDFGKLVTGLRSRGS